MQVPWRAFLQSECSPSEQFNECIDTFKAHGVTSFHIAKFTENEIIKYRVSVPNTGVWNPDLSKISMDVCPDDEKTKLGLDWVVWHFIFKIIILYKKWPKISEFQSV